VNLTTHLYPMTEDFPPRSLYIFMGRCFDRGTVLHLTSSNMRYGVGDFRYTEC
jgi:hypothetical protein